MTYYDTTLVVFKEDAWKEIEKYSGVATYKHYDPGFIEESYLFKNINRIPDYWHEYLGKCTQMDWGSWLSLCTKDDLKKILEMEKDRHNFDFTDIPEREMYGIFEVEIF